MSAGRIARLDGAGTAFDWPEAIGFGRQPFVSASLGPWQAQAGPQGLAIGSFGWIDLDTGLITNTYVDGTKLVFVLPLANPYNAWERVFIQPPNFETGFPPFAQMIIRPGVACITAVSGVFAPKFPSGGQAGAQVYADPATGLPYSGNVTGTYLPTPWTLTRSGGCGAKLLMSSFLAPFIN